MAEVIMKKFLLLASLLFAQSAFAGQLQWYDLELYNRYTLTQDITFENGLSFKAGQKFDMLDFIAGGVPVAYFEMHSVDCKNPDDTAEMVLVDVGQTVIAAQLNEGCNLGLFVELRDFFQESTFSDIE